MLSFTPGPGLVKALKSVQTDVDRLGAELVGLQEPEAAWLHRWALLGTVGASTRIENAVLTDAEIDWVDTALSRDGSFRDSRALDLAIFDKLSKDRERSVEEVIGCREVLGLVYLQAANLFPLSESAVRGLHHTFCAFTRRPIFMPGDTRPVRTR